MEVAGEFAALFFLQRQKPSVEAAVLGGSCRQARRHSIETVAQARQLRRQPAANPGAVTAVADLFQRGGQPVERPQRAADEDIDETDREAAEHAERREALGELVPHFEDLVVAIKLGAPAAQVVPDGGARIESKRMASLLDGGVVLVEPP